MTKLLTWLRARWRWVAVVLSGVIGLLLWWRKPALRGFLTDDDPTPVDLPKPLTPAQGAEAKGKLIEQTQTKIDELAEANEARKKRALDIINAAGKGKR
jgi:hypothetical protein